MGKRYTVRTNTTPQPGVSRQHGGECRRLWYALFEHEGEDVLVTFSLPDRRYATLVAFLRGEYGRELDETIDISVYDLDTGKPI